MKVYKEIGSKERFLEMFQNVNKVKVVEQKPVKKQIKEEYNEWGLIPKPSRIDESFDSPESKDKEYLDKLGNDNGQNDKYDGGTRYPVEKNLQVKNPALQGLKGDELPFNEDEKEDFDVEKKGDELEVEPGDVNDNGEEEKIVPQTEPEENPEEVEAGYHDEIPGGLADEDSPSEFDPEQIAKGIKVEMEHTDDPHIALEIAMDHLHEDPQYYGVEGEDPEKMAMLGAQKDANGEKSIEGMGQEGEDNEDKDLEDKVLWGADANNFGESLDFKYKAKKLI